MVMGKYVKWHALNIMKYHVSQHHTITTQGLLKWFFKQHLQFEVNYLKLCLLNEANNWHFDCESNHEHNADMATFFNLGRSDS
jgi:hypothetical protein